MSDYGLLACAAFFAGVLNTIAGGGTFLTLPALVFTGIPLVTANATSAVAVSPGYLGGAAGFRREISAYPRRQLLKIVGATLFGGLVGSLLLLVSSNEAFSFVVPFLLLIATTAFAFAEPVQKWAQRHRFSKADNMASLIVVAIYGGYFNGGLGIVLLALFACWGMRDLDQMNGLKNAISLLISGTSVATFALAGLVAWPQALVMMAAATIGGYAGAPLARRLPTALVRAVIIIVGTAMSLIFFARLLN